VTCSSSGDPVAPSSSVVVFHFGHALRTRGSAALTAGRHRCVPDRCIAQLDAAVGLSESGLVQGLSALEELDEVTLFLRSQSEFEAAVVVVHDCRTRRLLRHAAASRPHAEDGAGDDS